MMKPTKKPAPIPSYSWTKLPPRNSELYELFHSYNMSHHDIRAINLLLQYLKPEQRRSFIKTLSFRAMGNITKTRYVINWGTYFNIRQYKRNGAFCSRALTPIADQLLIQKLLIENDEREFLFTANFSVSP